MTTEHDHRWKRVVNEKGPNDEWVVVCDVEGCGKTRFVKPPKEESKDNTKPLLME